MNQRSNAWGQAPDVTVAIGASGSYSRSQDLFKGLRTAYNTLIQFLASNGAVAITLCGSPAYYMITFALYQSINHPSNPATYAFSSSSYTLFGILFLFWILALISVWKLLPNLLTVSIFVFTCIGHWCLVSGALWCSMDGLNFPISTPPISCQGCCHPFCSYSLAGIF
jgi:hypothetical protein